MCVAQREYSRTKLRFVGVLVVVVVVGEWVVFVGRLIKKASWNFMVHTSVDFYGGENMP